MWRTLGRIRFPNFWALVCPVRQHPSRSSFGANGTIGAAVRNHWTRDVQWEEDKTRSGNWALNASLAILRVALISVKFRQGVPLSWPRIFEQ